MADSEGIYCDLIKGPCSEMFKENPKNLRLEKMGSASSRQLPAAAAHTTYLGHQVRRKLLTSHEPDFHQNVRNGALKGAYLHNSNWRWKNTLVCPLAFGLAICSKNVLWGLCEFNTCKGCWKIISPWFALLPLASPRGSGPVVELGSPLPSSTLSLPGLSTT